MRRGVVESELFGAQKEVLQPDARRMDDMLAGVVSLLAANAEAFYCISAERNIWIVKTFPRLMASSSASGTPSMIET